MDVSFGLPYLIFDQLLSWLMLPGRESSSKDIELLVLRHEVAVRRRTNPRPRLDSADRAMLAASTRAPFANPTVAEHAAPTAGGLAIGGHGKRSRDPRSGTRPARPRGPGAWSIGCSSATESASTRDSTRSRHGTGWRAISTVPRRALLRRRARAPRVSGPPGRARASTRGERHEWVWTTAPCPGAVRRWHGDDFGADRGRPHVSAGLRPHEQLRVLRASQPSRS